MKTFKKPLTSAEEREYLKLLKEGDQTARDILIEHNMRLVAHIIKKYAFTDKEMDDLLSIGTIGLIKAVNTFNPDRGNKLSSYAAKCIDNEILMLLRSEKKRSREVSLYEPIGTDKEGNEINLMDVIEMDEREISELVAMKEDLKKLYEAYETCLSDKEKKKWLRSQFDGFCTEMEGAAIAQAAYLNGIPYLVIRAISDKADDSASVDYPVFEAQAIEHSVRLLLEMAEQLQDQQ